MWKYQDIEGAIAVMMTKRKIARATHNSYVWKIDGEVFSDDDGEKNAAGHILAVYDSMDLDRILIVVSRWDSGIKLGNARFNHIRTAASKAIEFFQAS